MKIFKSKEINMNWRIASLVAFAVALYINYLAGSTTVLGGVDTAAISDSFPNLFAPAGFTFAIWGVIYLLVTGFVLYIFDLVVRKKRVFKPKQINEVAALFTLSSVLNAAWLISWQYKILWLSVILMVGLLFSLIKINYALKNDRVKRSEWMVTQLPFSVYLGWISVATIANITTWLVSINWDGFGLQEITWMVLVLITGAVIGITKATRSNDWAYLLVFVWAYSGILFKHISSTGFNGRYLGVIACLVVLLSVISGVVLNLINNPVNQNKLAK